MGTQKVFNPFLIGAVVTSSLCFLVGVNSFGIGRAPGREAGASFTVKKLTTYSAACKGDRHGGKDESPSGLKPSQHTVDGSSKDGIVLAAVSQQGGMSELFGCLFTVDSAPGKVFFAGDRYAKSGNFQSKIDISHQCGKAQALNKNFRNQSQVRVLACSANKSANSVKAFLTARAKYIAKEYIRSSQPSFNGEVTTIP